MSPLARLLSGLAAASMALVTLPTAASAATGTATTAPTAQDVAYLKTAMANDLFEIVTGGVALNNAKYPTTRSYAKRIIEDHATAFFNESKIASNDGIPVPTALTAHANAELSAIYAKKGAAFDVAYLSGQVRGHFAAVAAGTKEIIHGDDAAIHHSAAKEAAVLRYHLWRGNLDLRYVRWAIRTHKA